jgi:hypothetical protein
MNRNNIVYTWQFNRNPFIDEPDLIEYIWGNMVGQTWSHPLSLEIFRASEIQVYPNPTSGKIYFNNIRNKTDIDIYTIEGRKLSSFQINSDKGLDLNLTNGLYLFRMTSEEKSIIKKIVVK